MNANPMWAANGTALRHPRVRGVGVAVAALAMFAFTAQSWARALPDFEQLVETNSPAIVSISTTIQPVSMEKAPSQEQMPEFFRRFFDQMPNMPQPGQRRGQGFGSGFVISDDGYILTNAHVIKDAGDIVVTLGDRRELDAEVIGLDTRTDVALVKVDAKNLPTVSLGNSDGLKVGQWVLAIGAPFGLEYSASQGIVSALSRNLPNDSYVPFIQTDVAVNPGNSGGPLFDVDGNVVGINSQIYSRTGGYMGLSFAIPINLAMNIADQLKVAGSVSHGWLGVAIQDMDRDLAESFDLDRPTGALVAAVTPNSPAAKAGVKPGDVIVTYNDTDVAGSSELPPLVGSTKPGTDIKIEVLRSGKEKTLTVNIGTLQSPQAKASPIEPKPGSLGAMVAELSPEQRKTLGDNERGVVVQQTAPDSPAAKAGLQAEDIVLSFNHQDVTNPEQLAELVLEAPKDKSVAMLVQRGDNTRFMTVTIPEATG